MTLTFLQFLREQSLLFIFLFVQLNIFFQLPLHVGTFLQQVLKRFINFSNSFTALFESQFTLINCCFELFKSQRCIFIFFIQAAFGFFSILLLLSCFCQRNSVGKKFFGNCIVTTLLQLYAILQLICFFFQFSTFFFQRNNSFCCSFFFQF